MKYIQTIFCRGFFTLEKQIDLNAFLNEDEQERFFNLRTAAEENPLSNEDYEWYEEVLHRIKEESDFIEPKITSYEVEEWEEYEEENDVVR